MSMLFDMNETIAFLLDRDESLRSRMLKLYEFEIAMHFCLGEHTDLSGHQASDSEDQFTIEVPEDAIREARLFAIMKLLQRETERPRTVAIQRRIRRLLRRLQDAGG